MLRQKEKGKEKEVSSSKPAKNYQAPSTGILLRSARTLHTNFHDSEKNRLHRSLAFLNFQAIEHARKTFLGIVASKVPSSDDLNPENLHDELAGLFIFSLECSVLQNGFFSEDPYYASLKGELGIASRGDIADVDKFIWLAAYRKMVAENISPGYLPGTEIFYWRTKEGLLEAIDQMILKLLEKINFKIKDLIEDYPSYESLCHHSKIFTELYGEEKKKRVERSRNPLAQVPDLKIKSFEPAKKTENGGWGFFNCMTTYLGATDPKRKWQCDWVAFVDKKCDELIKSGLVDLPKMGLPEHCAEAYRIRMAMFIFIMLDINRKQIASEWYSANGKSAMYDTCLKITNIKHLRSMNPGFKILCLQTLKELFEEKLLPNAETEEQKEQLIQFCRRINEHVNTLAAQQIHYSPESDAWLQRYIKEKSYTLIVHEGAKNIGISAASNAAMGAVGAAVGMVTLGPAGGVAGFNVGAVIGRYTLEPLLIQIVDRIVTATQKCAKDAYRHVQFDASEKGLEELLKIHAQVAPDFAEERRLAQALLSLPPHLLTEEKKSQIQQTENFKYYRP